ncbi:MAG: ribose 5-phosphate isomerase B [Candidatus Cloacimonadota bacterium]|nr:ribose 5-phosphate isomerase B [Candidatus Cloacimonadota bacterium]
MKIAIASDHAGFELKQNIMEFFKENDEVELVDYGVSSPTSTDYPDHGFKAAVAVSQKKCERGILICGSGLGMSIVANKVKGIRAALCHTEKSAKLSRNHNNANILVLAGRFIAKYLAFDIIEVWLNTEFEGGRHQRRIAKIDNFEKNK